MVQRNTPTSYPRSLNSRYTLQGRLRGHSGAILCLSATEDGKIASGGERPTYSMTSSLIYSAGIDGVNLWVLPTMTSLVTPNGAGQRGATTALVWVRREDDPDDVLFYGTQKGLLVCWKQSRNRQTPVSGQAQAGNRAHS